MSAGAIREVVGKSRDLTAAQNEALRPIVRRVLDELGSQKALEAATDWSQSAISGFLSGRQGASFSVALQICAMAHVDAFEVLGIKRPPNAAANVPDPPIGTFLLELREKPGLYEAVTKQPGRWKVSTIARALETPFQSNSTGEPMGGWQSVLDSLESGSADRTFGTAKDVTAATKKQLGRRPKLPPMK